MPLLELPVELVDAVATWLSLADLSRLCRVNRQLQSIAEPKLYRIDSREGGTAVLWAARNGTWATVQKWAGQGGDVRQWCNRNYSPLSAAVESGQSTMVQHFLNAGLDPYIWRGDRDTLLQIAARHGHTDVAELLLDTGMAVSNGASGDTPLRIAADLNYEGLLRLFLSRLGMHDDPEGQDLVGALQAAVDGGRLEATELLLQNGAMDNKTWKSRFANLLNAAARVGNAEIVRLLLHNGTNRARVCENAEPASLPPAVLIAAKYSKWDVLRSLVEWGAGVDHLVDGRNAIWYAADKGHEESVRLLVGKGVKVDYRDRHRATPLDRAVEKGYAKIAGLLVDAGADPGPKSSEIGYSYPLETASREGFSEIVEILLDKGADPNFRDYHKWTPLSRAVEKGYTDIVRLLLDHGADPEMVSGVETPPLIDAARKGFTEIVVLLLEHDADIRLDDPDGYKPIHAAARGGHEDIIRILLDRGADIESSCNHQVTPLFLSASEGDISVVKLLLDRGAKMDVHDEQGRTPLDAAWDNGRTSVMDLLRERGAPGGESVQTYLRYCRHDEATASQG